jgi:hypothetical protein
MTEQVDHSTRKHALLSASGAHRWLHCTPSARLEEKFEESSPSTSSVYADEGTLAHEFGDLNLKKAAGHITESVFDKEIKELKKHPLYSAEMEGEVDKYVTYVLEAFGVAKQKTPDAVLMIEERLDFSHLVEQGFGTGDAGIIADGILEIIDLKYGKGIRVEAEENPQLMLYGSGALRSFDLMYDIHTVKMTIVQPRLDHISSWETKVNDLISWGEKTVKPAAAKAYAGEGVQKAGDHCKWCKVKAMCATLAAKNVALARHEFKDPHLLTEKQLLEVYEQQPMLVDWVNSVSEYLLAEALKGKQWPGYKIVGGRSQRKWVDEDKVIETLELSHDPKDFMVSKLAGIPAIEKLLGKKDFPVLLGGMVLLPPGKPTLVPESDKRPAMGIEQARLDFKDEN